MAKIADVLKALRYKSLELLPYHKMGEHTCATLGIFSECFTVPNDKIIADFKSLIEQKL